MSAASASAFAALLLNPRNASDWWIAGERQLQHIMPWHCCTPDVPAVFTACARFAREREWDWPICADPGPLRASSSNLVYSVGINNLWSFDDAIAELGGEVHSFDPTSRLIKDMQRHRHANVSFHPWGLTMPSPRQKRVVSGGGHGLLVSDLFTLEQMKQKLGHSERRIPQGRLRGLRVGCL